jgi:hypothetical protein
MTVLNLPADATPRVTGPEHPAALAAPLAVAECATAAVATCLAAGSESALARTGRRPDVRLDTAHLAAAVRGEALLRDPAGHRIEGFAPLSRRCRWPERHAGCSTRIPARSPIPRPPRIRSTRTGSASATGGARSARPARSTAAR